MQSNVLVGADCFRGILMLAESCLCSSIAPGPVTGRMEDEGAKRCIESVRCIALDMTQGQK